VKNQTKIDAEEEMAEWRVILDHVEALYPIFAERGFSRGECLNAWILREIKREMMLVDDDEEDDL
jgi:hypothetical protein